MDVAGLEELAPEGLAGPALEEDVVGEDDGAAAVYLQQRFDVLQEVELLVSCLFLVVVQKPSRS